MKFSPLTLFGIIVGACVLVGVVATSVIYLSGDADIQVQDPSQIDYQYED